MISAGMKPPERSEVPLLNERGVLITQTQITGNGHTFAFADVASVRLERRSAGILGLLAARAPTFLLQASTSADSGWFTVCASQDVAFLERVEDAMGQAALAYAREKRREGAAS